MTLLAPLITGYLRDYMPCQRGYSPHSCETYAHGFRLLLAFAAKRTGTRPSQLHLEQLDAKLILGFLTHIEGERRNGAATRAPGSNMYSQSIRAPRPKSVLPWWDARCRHTSCGTVAP